MSAKTNPFQAFSFLFGMLVLSLIGCGQPPAPTPVNPNQLDAKGGVIRSSDEKASLNIPSQTLSSAVLFGLAPSNQTVKAPTDKVLVSGTMYALSSTPSTTLSKPATLSIKYDPALVESLGQKLDVSSQAAANTLEVARLVGNAWEVVSGSSADATNSTVQAPITEMGVYALLAPDGSKPVWRLEVRAGTVNVDNSIPNQNNPQTKATRARVNLLLNQYLSAQQVGLQAAQVRDVNVFVMPSKNGTPLITESTFEITGPSQQKSQIQLSNKAWDIFRIASQGEGTYTVSTRIEGQVLNSSFSLSFAQPMPVPQLTQGDYLPDNAGLNATWRPVTGARSYIMAAYDANGTLIRSAQVTNPQAELRFAVQAQTIYTVAIIALSWDNSLDRLTLLQNPPDRLDASAREVTFTTPPPQPPRIPKLENLAPVEVTISALRGQNAQGSFRFDNRGSGTLTYTTQISGGSGFSVQGSPSGEVSPFSPGQITIQGTCALTDVRATLTLTTNDPESAAVNVPLRLDCFAPIQTQMLYQFRGHGNIVSSLQWAGERIVSHSLRDSLVVWDSSIGLSQQVIRAEGGESASVALSPNGGRMALGGREGLEVWDAQTGTLITTIPTINFSYVRQVAFSPDGSRLVAEDTNQVVLYNATTGQLIRRLHMGSSRQLVWSPDGTRIINLGSMDGNPNYDTVIQTFDATGNFISAAQFATLNGTQALNADGTLALGTIRDNNSNQQYAIVRVADGTVIRTFGAPFGFYGASWSPDGQWIAIRSSSNGSQNAAFFQVELWRASNGTLARTVQSNTYGSIYQTPAWNSSSSQIALPLTTGHIRIVNVATGEDSRILGYHGGQINNLSFSSDNTRLLSSSQFGSALNWINLNTGETRRLLSTIVGGASSAWWLNNNTQVAVLPRSPNGALLRVYNAQTAAPQRSIQLDSIGSYAWSPDGSHLVFENPRNAFTVFNVLTNTALFDLELPNYSSTGYGIPFTWKADQSEIAGGSVTVWSGSSGRRLRGIQLSNGSDIYGYGCSESLEWSRDGDEFSCKGNIFDSTSGRLKSSVPRYVYPIRWSPSERTFLVGERENLRIISRTGLNLWEFTNPNNIGFSSIAFSPNGQYFAAGDAQGSLYVWRISNP